MDKLLAVAFRVPIVICGMDMSIHFMMWHIKLNI